MMNKYFPDEEISINDLYFTCYMIERVSRRLKKPNKYTVNTIGKENLYHLISVASVLHSENPLKVEDDWIKEYDLHFGNYDVLNVNKDLVSVIPTATQMGKVYLRLILNTKTQDENFIDALIRVYNHDICKVIDNYNASAYYEPSYVIVRAYNDGGF